MRKQQFIVLCGQVVGGLDRGFDIVYNFDGKIFDDRQTAISHGFEVRGSDDFNIGVIEGKRLVSLDWMDEPVDTERSVLAPIERGIYLP